MSAAELLTYIEVVLEKHVLNHALSLLGMDSTVTNDDLTRKSIGVASGQHSAALNVGCKVLRVACAMLDTLPQLCTRELLLRRHAFIGADAVANVVREARHVVSAATSQDGIYDYGWDVRIL